MTKIPSSTDDDLQQIPWEERKRLGLLSALWETWTEVLFTPTDFFRKSVKIDRYGPPLSYAILLWIIGTILPLLSLILFPGAMDDFVSQWERIGISFSSFVLIALPLMFITLPITLFALAGAHHLGIIWVGGNGGFKATFRTICYATSTMVFGAIPGIGNLISWIYSLVLYTKGFESYHHLSRGRAVFGALFPLLFGIAFVIIVTVLLLAFIGGAMFEHLRDFSSSPF